MIALVVIILTQPHGWPDSTQEETRVLPSDNWSLICIALNKESMYWFSLVKSLLFRCQQYLAQNANWGHLKDRIGIQGKTRVPGEKPLGTNNKLNPHMTARSGVTPHWWEASALTTAPSLLLPKSSSKHVNKETN